MRPLICCLLAFVCLGSGAVSAFGQTDGTADSPFSEIERAIGERRYERSLALLAEAPAGAERDRLTGEVRYFRGELEEAIVAYERYLAAAGDDPRTTTARFRLADSFARTGAFARAVELTQRGLDRVAATTRQAALAERLLDLGRAALEPKEEGRKPNPKLALRFFKEAKPFVERDAALAGALRFARARAQIALRQHQKAIQLLAPLLGIVLPPPFGPVQPDRNSGPKIDVDRRRQKPVLADPTVRLHAMRLLGTSLLALGQRGRAREIYRATLAADPKGPQAPQCLKGIAESFGFPKPAYRHALDEGTRALDRLVRDFPKSEHAPQALNALAAAHRAFNRPDKARGYAMQLVSNYPKSALALPAARQVAQILRAEKSFAEALSAYDLALATFSAHPQWASLRRERIDCEYERAMHTRKEGDRAEAARLLYAFLEAYPLDARAPAILLAVGEIAEASEEKTVARERYTALASKYPTSAQARTALLKRAKLEEDAGEYDAAIATLKSIRGKGGAVRLREINGEALDLETKTEKGVPVLSLTTRNIESVELRMYKISPVEYFQRHLTLARVAKLDVPLIRPDHTWTIKPEGFAKYKRIESRVALPNRGAGAFVVSAVVGERRATTLVVKSDLRLIARMAGNRVDTVVGTGLAMAPVEGARILIAGTDRVVIDGRSAEDGLFSGEVETHRRPSGRTAILAVKGDSIAWTTIEVPPAMAKATTDQRVLLWLDRTAYHTGDMVHLWSLGGRQKKMSVVIEGPGGVVFRRIEVTPDRAGFATAGVKLPRGVAGQWTARLTRGDAVIAHRAFQVTHLQPEAHVIHVTPLKRDVRLGDQVVFDIVARDRFGRAAPYLPFAYSVSGNRAQRRAETNAEGRARVVMPSDRFGLTDSVALDVYRNGRWVAGDVARVVWDGFRASVRPVRSVFLADETVRVKVRATTFDGKPLARDLTIVVRRAIDQNRSEEVCRVPVRTKEAEDDLIVSLPIEGEGAFSLELQGNEGMVPMESAIFVSGDTDPKRVRILADPGEVRPGSTMTLRVHNRFERVTAVVVAANHRDRRIRRVTLEKGTNEIPIEIREKDLPWLRVRIGVNVGKRFHTDEVTVAVDDPLSISLKTIAAAGAAGDVSLQLRVKRVDGSAARASGLVLLVPASLAPLYRGLFQGVAETFMGDTKAADSPLASSYPFTYRSGRERVKALEEQVDLGSNWASIVDRKAVILGSMNTEIAQEATVFTRHYGRNAAASDFRARTENIFDQALSNKLRQSGAAPGNVGNPMFLNQGSGRASLSFNESAAVLNGGGRSASCGTFQCVDANTNRWGEALVVNCRTGTIAIPTEDIESRRRRLAERLLASGQIAGPRVFAVTTDENGLASFVVDVDPGKWQAIALVSDLDGARFGEAGCQVERPEPVVAQVIAPQNPVAGDESHVDVVVTRATAERVTVAFELDGRSIGRSEVAVGRDPARARFSLPSLAAGRHTGKVTVGGVVFPVSIDVVSKRAAAPTVFLARRLPEGGEAALEAIRERLDTANAGPLTEAAWIIASLAARGETPNAAYDLALERRIARLLLGQRPQGGWAPNISGRSQGAETSIVAAWALGEAKRAGFDVPEALEKRLVANLRKRFADTHRVPSKSALLLGLSRLEAVDFAYANRLYRARTTLSTRDLGIVLQLLRRKGDDAPMVRTLSALLLSKQRDDGAFADAGPIDALSDERATTAICASALRGLNDAAVGRAVVFLRETPFSPAGEATGLALHASLLRELGRGERWQVRETEAIMKPVAVTAERTVRYAQLRRLGYPVPRGFNIDGSYRWTDDKTSLVGVGERCKVSLRVKLPYGVKSVVVVERIPAGFRVVPGSKNSRQLDVKDGVIRAHFVSGDPDRKGYTWHGFAYELEAVLPGEYAFQIPTVQVPGGAYHRVGRNLKRNNITVTAEGEDSRKGYQLTPQEYYQLGRIYWHESDDTKAYAHLETFMTKWRPRKRERVEVAEMLLDIDLRRGDHAASVDHFEIVKEGSPERSVPFRKILPMVTAYRALKESERALQVQRGALGGLFEIDFALGNALLAAGDTEAFQVFVESLFGAYPPGDAVMESRYFLGQTLLAHARKQKKEKDRDRWLTAAKSVFSSAMISDGGRPKTESSAFALAGTLLEQERYGAAAALSTRARELYSDTVLTDGFDYALAISKFELGQYDEARKVCDRIATARYLGADGKRRASLNRPLALHMLAKIHHARGEIAEAVEAYRKVRKDIPDAARALEYFEWRRVSMPELTELAMNEDRTVRLTYKNVDEVTVRAYRVDLMTLYLRERSLNRIAKINLAGIEPFFAGTFKVRPSTYRQDEVLLSIQRKGADRTGEGAPIPIVLADAGAYLIVVRSGNVECMGMILRSDLRMDVQTAGGALRATVYDRTTGKFESRVEVKFVGSSDSAFRSTKTDLRGVSEVSGLGGAPTVIAKRGDHFSFYRAGASAPTLASPMNRHGQAQQGGSQGAFFNDGRDRLSNLRQQLDAINRDNAYKVQQRQGERGGVRIKQVK